MRRLDVSAPEIFLVDMPFSAVSQPNFGLALIQSAIRDAGLKCSLEHLNLEFATFIGYDIYKVVAEQLPQEQLFGDRIFAGIVSHLALNNADPIASNSVRDVNRATIVPSWLAQLLPELQTRAASFVRHHAEKFKAFSGALIGFNLMFQVTPSLAMARELKESDPTKRVILGGANCEGSMGLAIHRNFPWIDFVCQGEGEELILELLGALRGDRSFGEIEGLIWRDRGRSVQNSPKARRSFNLDGLPRPRYDDWLLHRSNHRFGSVEDIALPVETSRGCWFGEKSHCVFCGLNGDSLKYRMKSPARVIEELRDLKAYGHPNVFAVDLIFPHSYFSTLLPQLARENLGLKIFYEVKSNLNRSQLEALRSAGIVSIQPGIESLSSPLLRQMKKGVTALQNIRLLRWCAELGINCFWNILYGFPGEDPGEYNKMATLIPLFTHLRPPVDGCCRVRFDRFSPLFNDQLCRIDQGVDPAPAYSRVYPSLPEGELTHLAYFFMNRVQDEEYVKDLRREVRAWHDAIGVSSLISVTHGHGIVVSDRRPSVTVGSRAIESDALAVFRQCDAGATRQSILNNTGLSESVVDRELDSLCNECGWVLEIDKNYISLVVNMQDVVPPGIPPALRESAAHAIHTRRMRIFCERSTVDLEKSLSLCQKPATIGQGTLG